MLNFIDYKACFYPALTESGTPKAPGYPVDKKIENYVEEEDLWRGLRYDPPGNADHNAKIRCGKTV